MKLKLRAAWPLLVASVSVLGACQQSERPSSAGVAKSIIERAKSKRMVELSWLGDKTCFVAESLSPLFYASEWFPGFNIQEDQYRDMSEGVWNLVVADDQQKIVRIYTIDQTTLRWNLPESTKVKDAVGCRSTVKVAVSGPSAELFAFGHEGSDD